MTERGFDAGTRRLPALIVLGLLAPFAAGCGGGDLFGSSKPSATSPPGATTSSSGGRTFSDRISDFISGPPARAAANDAAPGAPTPQEIDCPNVVIRQGASTLSLMDPKASSPAMGLRYQGTIARTARECTVRDKMVNIRIGVEGRIIVGPAGGPGPVTVPLRYALIKEGLQPKPVYTKLYQIPVTVASDSANTLFTHIEEEMTVPMPSLAEFDAYVIYVGYDPQGGVQEKKPPARPVRPATKPRPPGQG